VDDLSDALASSDTERISATSELLATALARADVDDATLTATKALSRLRAKRRFREVVRVAEAATRAGSRDPVVLRHYCQGLIEHGLLTPALATLSDVRQRSDLGDEAAEVDGLIGRANKQRYVETPDSPAAPRFLRDAVDAYLRRYQQSPSQHAWHGINAVATLARGERDGIDLGADAPAWRDLAREILESIADESAPGWTSWNPAIAAEAQVALGDFRAAAEALGRYAGTAGADAFAYAATLRQFRDVWQLDESVTEQRALVDLLEASQLRADNGAIDLAVTPAARSEQLAEDVDYLEAVFGDDDYQTIQWYRTGLEAASSVVRIKRPLGTTIGTGFVIRGSDLRLDWANQLFVLTNFHVVNRAGVAPGRNPDAVRVVFDDNGVEVVVEEVLDESPISPLGSNPPPTVDVAILRLAGTPAAGPSYSIVDQGPALGDRVYIIGYPLGQDLAFSLHDNRVIGRGNGVLHYRSPTRKGSSGSPLFDSAWQLVGIHHAGKAEMPRLDDPTGRYKANEGFLIDALRSALRTR
jgi:Trypsin-like peptidase domain/Tetratricopeptide Repeats-Sensor